MTNEDRVNDFCRKIYNGETLEHAYRSSGCDLMTTVDFCWIFSRVFPDYKYERFLKENSNVNN
jgi:hypothetical protein